MAESMSKQLRQHNAIYGDSAIIVMDCIVTRQRACVRRPVVADWRRLILADHRNVEIN